MNKAVTLLVCALMGSLCASSIADALRDPTQPLGVRAYTSSKSNLELQAIISRNNQRIAVVNGEMITEGRELSGRLLVKITDKYVVFNDKGKQQKLFLREDIYNAK